MGFLLLACEADLTCCQRFCFDYICPCMSTDDGSGEHEPLLGAQQQHRQTHQLVSWEVDPQSLETHQEQQQQQEQQQLQPTQEIPTSAFERGCEPLATHSTR